MKNQDNYLLQLCKITCSPKRENLITFYEMTERMKQLDESLQNHSWIADELERQERRIKLRIAFMMMSMAFKNRHNIDVNTNSKELVEKGPLMEYCRKLEKEANSNADTILKENPRKINEYDILRIQPRTGVDEIKRIYIQLLRLLEENINEKMNSGKYEDKDLIDYASFMIEIENSYKNLLNPNYKMKLDELLMQNFKLDQSSKYLPNNFAEITYNPIKKYTRALSRSKTLSAFVAKNSNGDEIIIIPTGEVGFGRFRQKSGKITVSSPYELEEYTIIKKYSDPDVASDRKRTAKLANSDIIWDDTENGEVFTVYGKIDTNLLTRKSTDTEYIRYNNDVLLSTSNLEAATRYNGGYIGEIDVDPKTNEYTVNYNRDRLCLAIDFEKMKRKRTKEGKPITGVPYAINLDVDQDIEWSDR